MLLAWLIGLIFLFPFYWVVVTSLNSDSQAMQFPPVLLPHGVWENYTRAFSAAPWLRYFANTLFIAGLTTLLVLLTSILGGFAFGAMRWPGRGIFFGLILSLMMIPHTVLLIPNYIILSYINWLNTYWAQIVPWGASVFGIFLLRQFFRSFPVDYWEAAQLDGASRLWYLWRVAVPSARPALITVAIYVFIGSWNSFLWPFIMASDPAVQPIEVGVANFLGTNGTDWTGLSAAVVFTTLPVMVLFLAAQREFIEGVNSSAGGIKG